MKVSLADLGVALGRSASSNTPTVQAAPAPPARRAPAAERAEAHRQRGNDCFAHGDYFEAAECYTSSLNAVPGNARALSNRSACFAALRRFEEALADAEAALAAEPEFAKAHSRRGLALWHLNRYHEAAEAYQRAVALDGSNADARAGLERAVASGGDARRAAAAREARKKPTPACPPPSVVAAAAQEAESAAAAARRARHEEALHEHESLLRRVCQQRRDAVAAWQRSTGTTMHKPEITRDRSIRVDVFGCLRGACAKTGCTMWRRDVAGAANWSDTRILTCEDCGATNTAHDDCGTYEIEDPQPPVERRMEAVITGVHQSTGF